MSKSGTKKRGWLPRAAILCVAVILMQACGTIPIFSPRVLDGVDENFDVATWWKAPNAAVGRKVELGGRLVHAEVRNGETFLVVAHLPIVDRLVYESFESNQTTNEYGIYYRTTIDPKWLVAGNHLMVVGIIARAKTEVIHGIRRTIPFITAECLHLWNSAGTPPPVLPLAMAEKFTPLEQVTYCTSGY
jgi:starvation-inducible outer membrane lipoprotein